MRLYAISDVHIDFRENDDWIQARLFPQDPTDALLVAGDVSDNLDRLTAFLSLCRLRFARVFYVPGNHDLWVRGDEFPDSLAKFQHLLDLCRRLDISTAPLLLGEHDSSPAWVVPLFSWYALPGESGSLYVPVEGDPGLDFWADNYLLRWPEANSFSHPATYFLDLNRSALSRAYGHPVISFSHFLPRFELLPPKWPTEMPPPPPPAHRRAPFNFTRVAGDTGLDDQIRALGSQIHIYGHQHRNRRRELENVTYISHCLGYPNERQTGAVRGADHGPLLVWHTTQPHGAQGL